MFQPFYGGKIHEVSAELKDDAGSVAYRVQGEWNSHYDFVSSDVSYYSFYYLMQEVSCHRTTVKPLLTDTPKTQTNF